VATAIKPLSIEDFEQLPAEMAEGHELVDGALIDVSGNTPNHNAIRDLLITLLRPFVRERRLGRVISEQEYDFNGNAHGPDVSFFGLEKRELLQGNKRVQRFVPDLAIEIISANDTFSSLLRKKERYRSCGTSEVWLISPDTCEVLVYSERGDRILRLDAELSTELLPGFRMTVGNLFETE
jgi:Uma2 family endonuclease